MTIEDIYPLTPLQEGLLFHHLYQEDSRAYCNQKTVRLAGPVDPAKLEEAYRVCAEENAMLRTSIFHGAIERPRQVVSREARAEFRFLDLSEAPAEERDRRFAALRGEDLRRGFDLKSGPLARLALIRFAEDEHRLLVTTHHVALDGWSAALLWRELAWKYERLQKGSTARREGGRRGDFKDYVVWVEAQDKVKALSYWKEYLGGYEGASLLNGARPRRVSYLWGSSEWRLNKETTASLVAFAAAQGVTLNALILAAWSLLAQRYCNSRDIVIGSVSSGRSIDVEGIERMIGLFVNTLPLRVVSSPGETVGDRARRIQLDFAESESNGHVSLPDIARAAEAEGSLFNHIVAFENYPMSYEGDASGSKGLSLDLGDVEARDQTDYDLDVSIFPEKELLIRFGYNENVYERDWIVRLTSHLEAILSAIASRGDAPLDSIALSPEPEQKLLLEDFQGPSASIPSDRRFHELFSEAACRWPEKTAAIYGEEVATYRDLEARSNALASAMIRKGARAQSIVGICMDRSIDFLVSMLAVFKSGCAYLPIDPDEPKDRLLRILDQSKLEFALTSSLRSASFSEKAEVAERRLTLIEADSIAGAEPPEGLAALPKGSSRDLAYVIFTSGSTGAPKGASVEHLGMTNHLYAKIADLKMREGERLAQNASQCFDISVWQFLAPLLSGGTVVIYSDDDRLSPSRSIDLARDRKIDILELTPSMCRAVLDELDSAEDLSERLSSVRLLMLTGEALPPNLCRDWLGRFPAIPIVNAYGPTECSDDVTHAWIREAPLESAQSVSIGRPLPNIRLYVVDPICDRISLQPLGVPGELCVAGIAVGKGYLNDPEQTRAKFLKNPFSGDVEERLYRTGDLARWLPDGAIDCLGRLDDQTKVNGFRIELSEIESALLRCPGVDEAAAIVISDRNAEAGLRAFYSGSSEKPSAELKSLLSGMLPYYMIPGTLVYLAEMPLNRSGKIDRKALRGISVDFETPKRKYVAPRTPLESDLARIFEAVFGKEKVGVKDSFFDLGGHSLIAMRLMSRIKKDLALDVPLKRIFEHPSVSDLAAFLAKARPRDFAPIPANERRESHPTTFAQERLFVLQQMQANSAAYNIVAAFELLGQVDLERTSQAVVSVVARHEILRTKFAMAREHPVQLIDDRAAPTAQFMEAEGAEVEAIVESLNAPFDLCEAPPVRIRIVRLAPERHLMCIVLHHILADGVSMEALLKDFTGAYLGTALAPLRIQYRDYAEWERARMQAGDYQRPLQRMLELIKGSCCELPLRVDFPRPKLQTFAGATVKFDIEGSVLAKLESTARSEGCSLYSILLFGFAVVLQEETGTMDFLVGANVANRLRPEVEDLIGLLLNQIPIRVKVEDGASVADQIARVWASVEESLSMQDLPFDYLVENSASARDLSRNPLFQVKFDYRSEDMPRFRLPSVELREISRERRWVRMDMQLNLVRLEDGLKGEFDYKVDLFAESSIVKLVERLKHWLQAIAQNQNRLSEPLGEFRRRNRRAVAALSQDEFSASLEGRLKGLRNRARSGSG